VTCPGLLDTRFDRIPILGTFAFHSVPIFLVEVIESFALTARREIEMAVLSL